MIQELENYLEKRGAKYFVTLLMICYILGTLVFTIYLGNLGISDFEFLQLRYMFTGIVFAMFTSILFLPVYFILRSIFKKASTKFYEIVFFLGLLFWAPLYALNIFPQIPSNFGGAKPMVARFIGETSRIKEINQIIEDQTGATNLPLEIFAENEDLAKGANVKILDRNKDRIWLILTKDLYLSSKSNLAKELTEAGQSLDDFNGEEFVSTPLFVETSGIKNISFSLYEPPKALTNEDLNIIKSSPKLSVKSTAVVQKFITEKLPEKAPNIIKALEATDESTISDVVDIAFDSKFLKFRQSFFSEGIQLFDKERSKGIVRANRWAFVYDLIETVRTDFEMKEISLENYPYLTNGIEEVNYPQKIARALQGAPDMIAFLVRLKRLDIDVIEEKEDATSIEKEAAIKLKSEDDLAIQDEVSEAQEEATIEEEETPVMIETKETQVDLENNPEPETSIVTPKAEEPKFKTGSGTTIQ